MSTVPAVVVHHANLPDTFACVASLISAERVPDSVIVVDNGETPVNFSEYNVPARRLDDRHLELSFAPDACAPVTLVTWLQVGNRGYAAALNAGMGYKPSDFYWLLNNDLIVANDALKNLLSHAERNAPKRLGVTGCKVLFHDRPNVVNAVGGKFSKWKAGGYNVGANQPEQNQFDTEDIDIDYPYGAAMFVHDAFVKEVGLLDESYFLYFEELDWTLRGDKKSFRTGYCPTSRVYHKQGASTGKKIKQAHQTSDTARWHYANLLKLYRKHYPTLIVVPYARLAVLAIKRLMQRRNDEAKLILKTMLGTTRP